MALSALAILTSRIGLADDIGTEKALRSQVEDLKVRYLQVEERRYQAQRAAKCTSLGRITFYVGNSDPAMTLGSIEFTIDGTSYPGHVYSVAENLALHQGGLHALACVPLQAGVHRVSVSARIGDAEAQTGSLGANSDVAVEDASVAVKIELVRTGVLRSLGLDVAPIHLMDAERRSGPGHFLALRRLFPLAPQQRRVEAGSAADPEVRRAMFLANLGRYKDAMVVLLGIAADRSPATLSPDYWIALAKGELAFGLLGSAMDHLRRAIDLQVNNSEVASTGTQLAEYLCGEGDLEGARAVLALTRPFLDSSTKTSWQDVESRLLLAQQKYGDAADLLIGTKNNADYESYVRYFNLGVALVRDGRSSQGLTALNRVGNLYTMDRQLVALRDRSNVELGRHFLNAGQGATAIPMFGRVGSVGPWANEALLGLGWAWLAPPGSQQSEAQLGDEIIQGRPPEAITGRLPNFDDQNLYRRYGVSVFERADVDSDEATRLKRALAVWTVLLDRSQDDEFVQQAFLAVAYALNRLGAHKEAAAYYERAAAVLDTASRHLEEAVAYFSDTAWIDRLLRRDDGLQAGEAWELKDLPPPALSQPVLDVFAGNAVQVGLHRYRDIQLMLRQLAADATVAPGEATDLQQQIQTIRDGLERAADQQRQLLCQAMVDELRSRQRRQRLFRESARAALATIYEGKGSVEGAQRP